MPRFPEEAHLRKVERLPGSLIALLDYPMECPPSKKPKGVTIFKVRVTKDRPKVGAIAEIEYYNADFYSEGEKSVFPIDQDRGVKVATEDFEAIIRDCAGEILSAIMIETRDSIDVGGTIKIVLPNDELLYEGLESAVTARFEPGKRKKVELVKEPEN